MATEMKHKRAVRTYCGWWRENTLDILALKGDDRNMWMLDTSAFKNF